MSYFEFMPPAPSVPLASLRAEVRAFLDAELDSFTIQRRAESWAGVDASFSQRVGAQGWIGMTWPKRYGGHERSGLERHVVLEEMLAAGAPVGAHWIADRQSGPQILASGSEMQRSFFLPRIAKGHCYFCIGMSEPDAGSDLAAARTRAEAREHGFVINGTKLWTTNAQHCQYMLLFCRTGPSTSDRHNGFSQFIVDLALPGISIRPIISMSNEHHFNEVSFSDVFVPATALLGELGAGWQQVTAELSLERSGPERFLSSFTLFSEMVAQLGADCSDHAATAIGRLAARFATLRGMSRSVADMLERGDDAALRATIVKDLGAVLEQEIPEAARLIMSAERGSATPPWFSQLLNYTTTVAPSFSLRGGTREILRGIIARGLGLR